MVSGSILAPIKGQLYATDVRSPGSGFVGKEADGRITVLKLLNINTYPNYVDSMLFDIRGNVGYLFLGLKYA